ncbi:MAG: DUF1285 domain-containing protein [Geminicoccaceae bacterium]
MTPIIQKPPGFDPAPFLARIARGEAACGDLGMRIDRDGRWHYRGSPIGRMPMVRLFASILHRLPDGSYWLVTPAEQGTVEVDDVPFVAVELRSGGEGRAQRLEFRTNLDDWVTAGPDHPLVVRPTADGSEAPYLTVRDGLEARLLRPVFYHLVELAEPEPSGERLGVWSDGVFFPIGSADA